jgi:tetratricopeptide (TPR) repeat protein
MNVILNLEGLLAIQRDEGRPAEVEKTCREVLAMARKVAEEYPEQPEHAVGYAGRQSALADLLWAPGRRAEAEALYADALARVECGARDYPQVFAWRVNVPALCSSLAWLYHAEGRPSEADKLFRRTLELWDALAREFPERSGFSDALAWLLSTCPIEGLREPRQALAHARRVAELTPHEPASHVTLALALYRAGQWQACLDALGKTRGARHNHEATVAVLQAMAHWQRGDRARARECHAEAARLPDPAGAGGEAVRVLRGEASALIGAP